MTARVARMLFVAAVFTVACAGNGHLVTPPPTRPSVDSVRERIAREDIGWTSDSIPLLRFNPPFVYYGWRAALEACSGLTRSGWPRFFLAPVHPLPGNYHGFFAHDSDAIVLAFANEMERWIVAHEILHWLSEDLIPAGKKGETQDEMIERTHPPELFGQKCAHMVNPPNRGG